MDRNRVGPVNLVRGEVHPGGMAMRIEAVGIGIDFAPWTPGTGRVFTKAFALECSTAKADDRRPWLTPPFVLGAACDGRRGHLVARGHAPAFLAAHADVPVAIHDAPLALAALHLLAAAPDVYRRVEEGLVWDVGLLHRLHCLATEGHTAGGRLESTPRRCASLHLGVELREDAVDPRGDPVGSSYGRWLGRDPREIEPIYLEHAARRAVVTYRLHRRLLGRLAAALRAGRGAWGDVSDAWLTDQIRRWGPATHHIQLRAAIVLREVTANGLRLDAARRDAALADLREAEAGLEEALRRHGYLPDQKGSGRALEKILGRIEARTPGLELTRTADGRISTSEEALGPLASIDPFVRALLDHGAVERLASGLLGRMGRAVVHPSFDVLKTTGRTSSFGELNAQGLPRDPRVRHCIIPRPGRLLFKGDYKAIEMAALAQGVLTQLGIPSSLADALNAGRDPHRMVAALATGKAEADVAREEREKAKPINFGKPAAMGDEELRRYARAVFGVDLADAEVAALSDAWFGLFPEMHAFLGGEPDGLGEVARHFGLTPRSHREHTGSRSFLDRTGLAAADDLPSPILGGMCARALGTASPTTRGGRPYDAATLDYLWSSVGRRVAELPAAVRDQVRGRRPSPRLRRAVLGRVGLAPVFTATGRLRAAASFPARRNTVFQGLAADGAKLALWLVWRAGYRISNFIHDELVVEVPEGPGAGRHAARVARLMAEGMRRVIPDVRVAVEYSLATSWAVEESRVGEALEVASDDPDAGADAPSSAASGPAPMSAGRAREGS